MKPLRQVGQRIGEYFLALVLTLSLTTMLIVAEPNYSYNSAAFGNSLALFIMWGVALAGIWFNIVWESENDD